MINKTIRLNQKGALDVMIIGIMTVVIALGAFTYWRVSSSSNKELNSTNNIEQSETLPINMDSLKTLDEIGQIAGVSVDNNIIKFVLESKDGIYIYKNVLSNGKTLEIDASTGKILKEGTTDVSDDDKIPAGVIINISPAQAFTLASQKSSSPIKSVEMEVEDKKVVYKIEFKDGSKVEIDATSGSIVKSEIKSQGDQEDEEDEAEDQEDEEDEAEAEDQDQEDEEDEADDESEEDR